MKIALRLEKTPDAYHRPGCHTVQWKESLPFFLNHRGLLIHRVRSVRSFLFDDELDHSSVHYLCNNFGTLERGELLADPPADRLVCAQCEAFAASHRLPSADELAGRHCHVGKLRVEQTCCRKERESN